MANQSGPTKEGPSPGTIAGAGAQAGSPQAGTGTGSGAASSAASSNTPAQPSSTGPTGASPASKQAEEKRQQEERDRANANRAASAPAGTTVVERTVEFRKVDAPPTKDYVLRKGKRHTHNGQPVAPGQVVPLTDAQHRAFRDKFIEEGSDNLSDEQLQAAERRLVAEGRLVRPQANVPIAEDIGSKTPPGEPIPNVTTDEAIRQRAIKEGR
jgi:hypothetical protein